MRVAFRATRTLHPTAPPELLGGAVEGTGAALVAAGGENAVTGIPVAAFPCEEPAPATVQLSTER